MSTSKFYAPVSHAAVLRKERETRPYCLEKLDGDDAPEKIALTKKEMVIGRGEDADIHIISRRASRHHAFLKRRGTEYVLRDNDSHNGIFLNGVKIHSAVLRDGDVIQIADSAFVYCEG